MPHTGSLQLRVHATFVVTLYACTVIGGALLHHSAFCPDTPGPHCALCACVNTVPLVADIVAPPRDFDDAGEVAPIVRRGVPVTAGHDTASRAPPAAQITGNSPGL
jgi:hypothetical protein